MNTQTIKTPTTPSMRLDGLCAVVTGAGRGLGRASALALAEAGADVVLISRTPAELEEVALSRTGKLWSYTTNHYKPPEPYVAPDPFTPYTVAAVELIEERIVVLGQLDPEKTVHPTFKKKETTIAASAKIMGPAMSTEQAMMKGEKFICTFRFGFHKRF